MATLNRSRTGGQCIISCSTETFEIEGGEYPATPNPSFQRRTGGHCIIGCSCCPEGQAETFEKIEEKKDLGFIPSMVQRYCNSSNNARNTGDEKNNFDPSFACSICN